MIRRDVPMAELPAFFKDAFGRVAGAISAAGAQIAGAPLGWYFGVPGETVDVAAGRRVCDARHIAGLSPSIGSCTERAR